MPEAFTESSTMADQNRNRRKPRNPKPISDTDSIYSIVPSNRSKSTSPTHDHPTNSIIVTKKMNFTKFKGLGCAASSQVSVPSVIRTSADWDSKRVKKKKKSKSKNNKVLNLAPMVCGDPPITKNHYNNPSSSSVSSSCVNVPDVWCGPGIGLTTDAASVDCVVSRRPVSGRRKIDGEKVTPREQSCPARRMVSPEDNPFLDTESDLGVPRSKVNLFGSRHHRHSRHGFPEDLAEIVMLQNSLMGGRTDGLDRYRNWRLDVDNMSYEELLELGDRIGYVSTGLRDDEITRCVRKTKPFFLNNLPHILTEQERKCSICQEEYEAEDDMGKLGCGHFYHVDCIKLWLLQKNSCPVCKSAAASNS